MGKHEKKALVEVSLASGAKEYWFVRSSKDLDRIASRYYRTARVEARTPQPGEIDRLVAEKARFKSLENWD